MPAIDGAYQLLLARLMAIEADMADLRERVQELEAELHEARVSDRAVLAGHAGAGGGWRP